MNHFANLNPKVQSIAVSLVVQYIQFFQEIKIFRVMERNFKDELLCSAAPSANAFRRQSESAAGTYITLWCH